MITLKDIEGLLVKEEFPCHLVEPEESHPFPRLVVSLGSDPKEREVRISITLIDQLLAPSEAAPTHQVITYHYLFPFPILAHKGADVARLVAMLNSTLVLPALQLNEIEQEISYRCCLLNGGEALDTRLVVSVLGTMLQTIDRFTLLLEELATAEKTFLDYIDETVDLFQKGQK
jgi:hypothetical protein